MKVLGGGWLDSSGTGGVCDGGDKFGVFLEIREVKDFNFLRR